MARLVLDTNVVVSAIIGKGAPRALLLRCIEGQDTLLSSPDTMKELVEVLRRPKFRLAEEEIHGILAALAGIAEVVEPRTRLQIVAADPDDDRFLELAVHGRADMVVSGDSHLLDLESFRGIPILQVATALARLGKRPSH